jgi:hypothetical protein
LAAHLQFYSFHGSILGSIHIVGDSGLALISARGSLDLHQEINIQIENLCIIISPAGIGVDDMFVIMGAYNNLEPVEQRYDLPRKMGDILRHAGVSTTVTSITDFVAFGIGATTVSSLFSF